MPNQENNAVKTLIKSLAPQFIDFNGLTRRDKARAAWYAWILLAPVAAVLLAYHLYAPSLNRIMGW